MSNVGVEQKNKLKVPFTGETITVVSPVFMQHSGEYDCENGGSF